MEGGLREASAPGLPADRFQNKPLVATVCFKVPHRMTDGDRWTLAVSFAAYYFFLRTLLVLHATWMVNSLSHHWGYQSYATKDESRNNALGGLLAHGEEWHNNHHHCQASVNHGHRWWEFDFSFPAILFVALLGRPLAWVGWGRHRPVYDLMYFDHRKRRIRILFPE